MGVGVVLLLLWPAVIFAFVAGYKLGRATGVNVAWSELVAIVATRNEIPCLACGEMGGEHAEDCPLAATHHRDS